jgi:hypothetical protein
MNNPLQLHCKSSGKLIPSQDVNTDKAIDARVPGEVRI